MIDEQIRGGAFDPVGLPKRPAEFFTEQTDLYLLAKQLRHLFQHRDLRADVGIRMQTGQQDRCCAIVYDLEGYRYMRILLPTPHPSQEGNLLLRDENSPPGRGEGWVKTSDFKRYFK